MSKLFRGPLVWILLGLLALVVVFDLAGRATGFQDRPTSQIIALINSDDPLTEVELINGEQEIRVTTSGQEPEKLSAHWVEGQSDPLVERLEQRVADGSLQSWSVNNPSPNFFTAVLPWLLPLLIIGLLFFFLINSVQGGGSRVMQFGKSKAKVANKDTPKTTFSDVAGADEAIEELQEIREFLSEPAKFQAVGAKIPKGVLLYGPPGTGKTLLARAVAGEAKVPFFSISGSDFVEMFVGVGASRVRDLFEQAKENAPAIIFVDEIDAVGRHRGAGMGGGHDEREQTLNQLLVEMDGFDVRGGVILIAATNRPDVLDPALLRPGRFDRQIAVEAPDLNGRTKILSVHAQGKPLDDSIDLASVARRTPGFTGADLANVLNEAALLAARSNQHMVTAEFMDEAIDRVIAGPQKRTRLMNDQEKLITAYHEGGHALVAAAMPATDPVQKVTILPRGRALGYTMVMPDNDKYSNTRNELLDQLAYMMGGRAAEELVFHDPTTGASNDIEKATKVARAMVTEYGMTERLGAIRLGSGDQEPFLGRDMSGGGGRTYSDEVAAIIDAEVSSLVTNAHNEAFQALEANRDVLDELVRQLFEYETLNKEQVAKIFEPLRRWPKRPAWTGSDDRRPSALPPVDPPPRKEQPELEHVPVGAPLPPGHVSGAPQPPTGQGPAVGPGPTGPTPPGPTYPGHPGPTYPNYPGSGTGTPPGQGYPGSSYPGPSYPGPGYPPNGPTPPANGQGPSGNNGSGGANGHQPGGHDRS